MGKPGAKKLDKILSVTPGDVHLIITPAGVPTPIPHPCTSIIKDSVATSVKVTGQPGAVKGSISKHTPPHIPQGGTFSKPPTNQGEIFITTSMQVFYEDKEAAVLGDTAKMCADPVDQPVGKVVGTAATVLVAATSSGSGGEGDGEGDAQKAAGAGGAKAGGPGLAKTTAEGHPVDVVTGNVLAHGEDLTLEAPIPLQFVRTYCSATAGTDGPMGHGWSHNFQQRIERVDRSHPEWAAVHAQVADGEGPYLVYYDTNGVPTTYQLPPGASEMSDQFRRRTIRCDESGYAVIDDYGIVTRFLPLPRASTTFVPGEVVDRNGNRTRLRYDGQGRVSEVEDTYGRVLIVAYDDRRISELRLRIPGAADEQRWCAYAYDRTGDMVGVTDRAGATVQYVYADHLLVEDRNADGYAYFFAYDAAKRCLRTWGQDGYLTRSLDYDPERRCTRVVNGEGETTLYRYNERGVVDRTEHGADFFQQTRYDDEGRVLARSSGRGIVASFEYDAAGRIQTVTDGEGNAQSFVYNSFGQVTRLTEPLGQISEYEYDARGNLVMHTAPTGATIRYEHDERGRVVRQVFHDGRERVLNYDRFGHVSRRVEGSDVESYRWDAVDNLLNRELADGTRYAYEWNAQGLPTRETRDDEVTGEIAYTPGGYVIALTDAAGILRRFSYGPPGVAVAISEYGASSGGGEAGLRSRIAIDLDTEGRPRKATNELDLAYRFSYDASGRLGRQTNPDGKSLSFEYDAAGFVAALRTNQGDEQHFEYNGRGLPTRILYADGSEDTFEYDGLGRATAATNRSVRLEWEYDAAGQAVVRRQGEYELRAEPDEHGARVSWYPSDEFRVDLIPDASGRGLGAVDFGGRRISLSSAWTPGLVEQRELPNGVTEVRAHDARGRLATAEVRRGTRVLARRQLEYRPDGLLDSIVDSVRGDRKFVYDAIDRLIEVKGAEPERYVFDPAGNITSSHRVRSTVIDAPELLRRLDGRSYDYDGQGRVTRIAEGDRTWSLRYDAKGQLAAVDLPDGGTVQYAYDPLGRRIEKRFEGGSRDGRRITFVWNGGTIFKEEESTRDAVSAERFYLFLDNAPCLRIERDADGEQSIYYHNDHLGTPQFCTDERGEVVWSFGGDSYGYEALRPDDFQNIRLPGQYYDEETGLHYNRFRYYDPVSARYLQPDPLDCLADPNRFHYPFDPLGTIDPLGLFALMVLNADPGDKTILPFEQHALAGRMHNTNNPARTGYGGGTHGTMGDLLDPNLHIPSNVNHIVINAHGCPTSIAVGKPGLWARIRRKMPWDGGYTAGSMSGKELAKLLKSKGFTGKVTLVACSTAGDAKNKQNFAQELADGLGQGSEVVAWDEAVIVDPNTGRASAVWNMGEAIPSIDSAMYKTSRGQTWDVMPESWGRWTHKPGQPPVPG